MTVPATVTPKTVKANNQPVKAVKKFWPASVTSGGVAKVPNFGPKFVRRAMPWFETYWHSKHKYPDDSEVMAEFGVSLEQVKQLNSSKFWLTCLDSRGITRPGLDEWSLTDRQVAAITIITNFNDLRPPLQRLAAIAVTEEELNGWYQNPHFKRALADRADTILDNVSSDATAELARAIKKGNFQAIKFYYEITGRAQSPESVNVKQAMQILIEAIQKHVKDPATLSAIAQEVETLRAIKGLQ